MTRVILGLEYDGSTYSGWQYQKDRSSVQACLEQAVSRVADETVCVTCAGRTDAGVHALEQVVHFDTRAERSEYAWVMGSNTHLPDNIRVTWAKITNERFHARYSAIARFYRYTILNRKTRSALLRKQVTWYYHPLDENLMHQAAQHLLGEQNFTSYRAQGCQSKSPYRRMYTIQVTRQTDRVLIDLVANAFLHHMVRNIAGVLMAIGGGKHPPGWSRTVLLALDRTQAAATAPPDGLYLGGVLYPAEFGLPRHPVFETLPANTCRYEPGVW